MGHPGCKRTVSVSGTKVTIDGIDGKPGPGCGAAQAKTKFSLEGSLKSAGSYEVLIDFSKKGGKKDTPAKWDINAPVGIKFPDGNKWVKFGLFTRPDGLF